MTDPLRVGVIGVGSMGRHHVRVYDRLSSVSLVGVADADENRAQNLASEFDTTVLSQSQLLERADAVSVAVPTQYHREVAVRCANHGVHTIIEKPLAGNVADGRAILDAADAADTTVQVGHVERFNPAVRELSALVDSKEIIGCRAERLGPPPDREVRDNAIVDLMIHDVDIISSLVDGEAHAVQAAGTHDNKHATATIEFDGSVVASLTASRLTQRKIRRLRVTTEDRVFEVDYLDQSVEIYRRSQPSYVETDAGEIQHREQSIIERPQIQNIEPLKAELSSFIDCIRDGNEPIVSGEDGLRAVELAERIDQCTDDLTTVT